jgi:hypothetical protein
LVLYGVARVINVGVILAFDSTEHLWTILGVVIVELALLVWMWRADDRSATWPKWLLLVILSFSVLGTVPAVIATPYAVVPSVLFIAAFVELVRAWRRDRALNPPDVNSPPAGWYVDPSGQYEFRYWDGEAWTDHVASGGIATTQRLAQ